MSALTFTGTSILLGDGVTSEIRNDYIDPNHSSRVGPVVTVVWPDGVMAPQGHGVAASALRVELPTDGTGRVGIDQTTPGTSNGVLPVASTGGGRTRHNRDSTGTSLDLTSPKASAGAVTNLLAYSTGTRDVYLKLYDSVGAVTVGTTATWAKVKIPAGGVVVLGTTYPLETANRVAYALTVNSADADTTPVNAGEVVVGFDWK